jgi:hypothetical protein
MSVPGGEQIARPGWDGVVDAESGNSWLPVGGSYWEMGCAEDTLRKAKDDYAKRSKIPVEQRHDGGLIFVSPRNRPGKERWVADRAGVNDWRDVRVYDASDLEQRLEHTPAVALWFAEQIGLSGPGVESADQYWDRWSKQSEPHISLEAILAGRSKQNEKLRQAIQSGARIVTIRADSVEEAAPFATASILTEDREDGLHGKTLVVSDSNGWRYVVANPDACVAIAARPEVATQNTQPGLTIILPLALGDRGSHFQGLAAREGDKGTIVLERPLPDHFEAALTGMGFDGAETQRMNGMVHSVQQKPSRPRMANRVNHGTISAWPASISPVACEVFSDLITAFMVRLTNGSTARTILCSSTSVLPCARSRGSARWTRIGSRTTF